MRDIKRSLAVVIGINDYSNGIPRLETAVNDAQDLAELLREKYDYQVRLLLNQEATQSRLNDLLADLTRNILPLSDGKQVEIKRDDRLLFFFAGHGFASDVQNNTDGLAGYLVPQDGQRDYSDTWVSMQRLHDSLTQLPCRHLLVILDCCFAGSFRWAVRDREAVRREKLYRERYEQYVSGIAQQVITSADHDETAADSPYPFGQRRDNISGHSPFAELLLRGLRGEADYTKDNIITATELFLYLESELPKTTTKQTPKLSPLKRHGKGNYIFPLTDFDRNLLLSHPKPSESEESEAEDNNKLSTKLLLNEILTLQQLTMLLGSSGWGRSNLAKSRLIKPSTLRDLSLKYIKILTESKNKDREMSEEDREDSGQLTQSLTQRADWEYEQLVGRDRAYANTIRNVMLRMVALDGGELVRRRVPDDELVYLEPENTRVKQVINRFCAAGLLVRRQGTEGNGYVEPVDDILEEWSKVLLWKQQELRNLLLQRELTPIAYQWENQKHDKQAFSLLWNNDPRLPLVKQIFEQKDSCLNAFESEFVKRSIKQGRRKRRRIIFMIGGAIASLYGLTLLALYQLEASRLQEKAEIVKTLFPTQPLEGLVLAIQTMGENKSWMPWNILKPVEDSLKEAVNITREKNSFQVDKGIVNSVAISPDNKTIAAGFSNGKLYLWKLQERPTPKMLAALNNSINSVAFSPKNSNIIVAGSSDGKLRLWNLQGQPTGKTLAAHKKGINSVVFSPDGNTIVTGGGDGQLRLWKLQGQPIGKPLTVGNSGVSSVAVIFNRKINSTIVVSGSLDGKVSLWNVKQGKQIKAFFAHKNGVNSVSFSPNGQTIITGGGDGQVRRWKWGGQQIGQTFTANEFGVTSVAFIDDKTTIGSSMTVRRWNLQGKQIEPPFRGHSRLVKSIAISRDRQLLVTGGDDGIVKLWDLQSQQKNGLQIACDRLQYHPILTKQKAAKDTCKRYVWNH